MIENYVIITNNLQVTTERPDLKLLDFRVGQIISADVMDIIESGMVALQIIPPIAKRESVQGKLISAHTDVHLSEGDRISLKVIGTGKEIKFKFLGIENKENKITDEDSTENVAVNTLLDKLEKKLATLSNSKLNASDLHEIKQLFSKIPDNLKTIYPELKSLERLLPQIEQISPHSLKIQVDDSGILLETKLKNLLTSDEGLIKLLETPNELITQRLNDLTNVAMKAATSFKEDTPKLLNIIESLKLDQTYNPKDNVSLYIALDKIEELLHQTISFDINTPPSKIQETIEELTVQARELLTLIKHHDRSERLDELERNLSAIIQKADKPLVELNEKRADIIKHVIDSDMKVVLLKARNILKSDEVVELLKHTDIATSHTITSSFAHTLTHSIDKLINNIEYYQTLSRMHDMVFTFLPFSWKELKDGELIFKKNKYHTKRSYTCDINLDLLSIGKVSISITVMEGEFFVTFKAETAKTKELIGLAKEELERGFASAGLKLKAFNIGLEEKIDFSKARVEKGLDIVA
ncbi:MAG: flagellar hook-length control protein FliK [Candidatus Magnetoovum sp. WYHC-5]|nr:flagellar hook-length control protein FliK [Candidatus Magnetoovum sp. WYHC-5]